METQELELCFLVFFRSAIGICERRIGFSVHATASAVLRAFGRRYGSTGSNRAVGASR
jgi:hypothetical protein